MDRATLIYLLRGGHLNMPDRIALGLWPHPPLRFDEVVRVLAEHLTTTEWFPCPWQPPRENEPVREGGVVQRVASDRFVYRSQAASPVNPAVVTRSVDTIFVNAEAAARHYLRWDLRLPGDLDGWKVME